MADVALQPNGLVSDTQRNLIYAIVPGSAPALGNTVTVIDPTIPDIVNWVAIGQDPLAIKVSSDNASAWVYLDGTKSFARFDCATQTKGNAFYLPTGRTLRDFDVDPFNGGRVIVIPRSSNGSAENALMYDQGVLQSKSTSLGTTVACSDTIPNRVYGYDGGSTWTFFKGDLTATGIEPVWSGSGPWYGQKGIFVRNGWLFNTDGAVYDAETYQTIGIVGGGSTVIDKVLGRAFVLNRDFNNYVSLTITDLATFQQTKIVTEQYTGEVGGLARWGTNGIAYRRGNYVRLWSTIWVNGIDASLTASAPLSDTVVLSGTLFDLRFSDNGYAVIAPATSYTKPTAARMTVDCACPVDSPTEMRLSFEASASIAKITQNVYLLNVATGNYDLVDQRVASTGDNLVRVDISGSAARYVDPATHRSRALVEFLNPLPGPAWRASVDLVGWRVSNSVPNGSTISGTVTLQDYLPGPANVPAAFKLWQGANLIDTINGYLTTDGAYSFSTGRSGTFRVTVKASHWLAKSLGTFTLHNTTLDGIDASLVNGDVDGDNVISAFDYGVLSNAFDSVAGDPLWNPKADLDGDGAVTVFDYGILSDNFDMAGDE